MSMISRSQPETQDTPTVSVYIFSAIDLCRFLRFLAAHVWKGARWSTNQAASTHPLFKPAILSRWFFPTSKKVGFYGKSLGHKFLEIIVTTFFFGGKVYKHLPGGVGLSVPRWNMPLLQDRGTIFTVCCADMASELKKNVRESPEMCELVGVWVFWGKFVW